MENKTSFRMPAEWGQHTAIWLSWPHDTTTFPYLKEAEAAYIEIVQAIHKSELVNLFVLDEVMKTKVEKIFIEKGIDLSRVKFWIKKYSDVWFRDYGPIFVVKDGESGSTSGKKKLAMVNFIFNAWGEKYAELMLDTDMPAFINETLKLERFEPGIVLEGGSIDVDGAGTLLTTEQCLLNKNRNPKLSKTEIENYLKEYLGVEKIIWLKEGVEADDTDGHIDDIARFVGPHKILCAYEDDEKDFNHKVLKENYKILKNSTDASGTPLKVVKLPMPGFVGDEKGRLPASYANFYIGNEVVMVPIFGTENDKKALEIIQSCFPSRKVIGINCKYIVYGLGTIHCISQQQPLA
ncbi:MAG: agmatine deiminase family protein [Candidatus Gracilibacteria bacterium]|jgi:agmatine deiminase